MFRLTLFLIVILLNFGSAAPKKAVAAPSKDYSSIHAEALEFCKQQNFCTAYYFLVDLSVHSGKNRFYVYSFNQHKVTAQNLVTHGSCDAFEDNSTKYEKVKFSNRNDSHCSSAGKYKVGKRDYSSWGIKVKYWLHGLESTNNNAQNRVIVLHSWDAVADTEVYPDYSPLSWGCPAVADSFMHELDVKLQATDKPVLLWIVE
ncbi:peptidase [Flavobacterium sp. Sd200]|uniref:murein L,D-transpeptidase catalytic domain-containing protein n=1 Tax=Flavobacterium sp. Sd200 TaxID=2692211 RepID=UPI0013695222|nr:murein L,D-transpeptidase catalytic domain family protein [Flavobacterium sp. Sd200]MXN92055.1 peptidase [Flavobacterium sp. Sd200]